jgi:hypothetical protein
LCTLSIILQLFAKTSGSISGNTTQKNQIDKKNSIQTDL